MFNDSLISLMIMLLLCFMGMLVMFLFVIRSLSVQTASLREGFARQQSTEHFHLFLIAQVVIHDLDG